MGSPCTRGLPVPSRPTPLPQYVVHLTVVALGECRYHIQQETQEYRRYRGDPCSRSATSCTPGVTASPTASAQLEAACTSHPAHISIGSRPAVRSRHHGRPPPSRS